MIIYNVVRGGWTDECHASTLFFMFVNCVSVTMLLSRKSGIHDAVRSPFQTLSTNTV